MTNLTNTFFRQAPKTKNVASGVIVIAIVLRIEIVIAIGSDAVAERSENSNNNYTFLYKQLPRKQRK